MKGSQHGYILNSDMTVSSTLQNGKTPIGIVVCSYAGNIGGQAMSLFSNGNPEWGPMNNDIPTLQNYSSEAEASQDTASYQNTEKIIATGNKDTYPAAWAAYEYSTEGTSAGDWSLPAAGIFSSFDKNRSTINQGIEKINEEMYVYINANLYPSSTERSYQEVWSSFNNDSAGLTDTMKWYDGYVYPVIGFCKSGYEYDKSTDTCKSCGSTYKYTCSGTGYAGGSGTACGGKYTACTCSSGYVWNGSSCAISNACMKGSQLGYILNSDMTVTSSKQSGKTPIGVVVCSYSGGGGQAMALKSIGNYAWGGYGTDISTLPNLSQSQASQDVASCENSAKIRAQGNSSTYPAVWAAYNYTTTGTKVGDWCLPAAGIFTSYYNNQSVINTGFSRAGGTKFTTSTYAWSSSESSNGYAWTSTFTNEYGLSNFRKTYSGEVRPVLEF